MSLADDPNILGHTVILRGLKDTEVQLDASGNFVISGAAFRTEKLSAFRTDQASESDVFQEYPRATRIASLTVQDIRDVGCIICNVVPPKGHVEVYRKDRPGDRIGSGPAGQMARRATLLSVYNGNQSPW